MYKTKITHKNTYAEIDQANPMRWRIMHKRGDTYYSQSGLIKCKDFFNDVVAFKKAKKKFSIYSFSNQIKFNKDGVYFLLSEIADPTLFVLNLTHLNAKLVEQLGVIVSVIGTKKNEVLLCIPNKLWNNTYYISLVSMMIRLCNYNTQYTSWEDFFAPDAPLNTIEKAWGVPAKNHVKQCGFSLAPAYRKYWYYAGGLANSLDGKEIFGSVIHNNGVNNWCNYMLKKA